MVQQRGNPGPATPSNLPFRQAAALPVAILLYTAATPFTPVGWLTGDDGSSIFDRLFGGIILVAACYFQWAIASLSRPLAVALPGSGRTVIVNGFAQRSSPVGYVWDPSNYWTYLVFESLALALAEFGPSEALRKSIVCGAIAGLWAVGYCATPESTKRWAYDHLKTWVFWRLLNEAVGMSYGQQRRPRRW